MELTPVSKLVQVTSTNLWTQLGDHFSMLVKLHARI